MTVRKFGLERTAARMSLAGAILALSIAAPALAQRGETPASPSGSSIDFRLPPAEDARAPGMQGPTDNGLPPLAPGEQRGTSSPEPTPAPQPGAPRVVPTQPAAAPETPAPTRSASTQTSRDSSPRVESRAVERPAAETAPAQILPEAASSAPVVSAPESGAPAMPVSASDAAAPAAPAERAEGTPLWAWLLAVLAALGAGIWYWRRRPVAAREALAEPVEKIEPASAPVPAPSSPPRDAPVPSRPAAPSPAPAPVRSPAPAPRAASPLVTRPVDEQRASVAMTLEIRDIHVTADQVAVGFALNLVNRGAVAATGLMVRIALGQGSAMPEAVLARFFDGAGGSVLRDDMMLLPGAGEQLSTEVMLPRAMIEPLMIGGRPMLVPVMAFDVTYHWDGPGEAFGQYAGSFVLGREPGEGGGKLAPLPLDRAELRVANPGQRATAMRREQ